MSISYESFIKTQTRNMVLFATHTEMSVERVEGDYTVFSVDGVDFAKEHNLKDDVILLEIPKKDRPWFAGFNKAAQEHVKELIAAKKNRKPINTKALLDILAESGV